jgi:hypothetical protein
MCGGRRVMGTSVTAYILLVIHGGKTGDKNTNDV